MNSQKRLNGRDDGNALFFLQEESTCKTEYHKKMKERSIYSGVAVNVLCTVMLSWTLGLRVDSWMHGAPEALSEVLPGQRVWRHLCH